MTILGTSGGCAKTIFDTTKCPFCDEILGWWTNRMPMVADLTKQYTWTANCPNDCPVDLRAEMCCLTLHGEFS